MAQFLASIAFNINDLDLNWYERNIIDIDFFNNVNAPINVANHQDIYSANANDGSDNLFFVIGGTQITTNSDEEITGGTATGVAELDAGTGSILWSLEGISTKAKAIFEAALTLTSNDEFKLLRQALSGDDNIQLSSQADIMNGFDGNDTMMGNGGDDLLLGGKGNDIIRGGDGDDTLRGNAHADRLFGDDGNDLALGAGGVDRLFGGNDNDVLKGGGGNDIVNGGADRDKVIGNGGDDDLQGGLGNDILSGGAGNDMLNGGRGNDLMKGLGGIDTFIYEIGGDRDKIKGYQDGTDKIDLTDFNFANAAAALAFASQSGSDTVFNFGNGDVLMILNIAVAQITGADLDL